MSVTPLISIIVPIYNVEKYLNKCLDSIVNQTYRNLEILLIDDGSTDDSLAIAENWAKGDSRIRIFHQENLGTSAARNKGLSMAKGDYIGYVDSDDYLEYTMYEKLLDTLVQNQAQVAIGGYDYDGVEAVYNFPDYVLNQNEIINEYMNSGFCFIVVWNKLYSRSIIDGIKFIEGMNYEDNPYSLLVLSRCSKVAFCNEVLYHYHYGIGYSTTNSLSNLQDHITAKQIVEDYINNIDFVTFETRSLLLFTVNLYMLVLHNTFLMKYLYGVKNNHINRQKKRIKFIRKQLFHVLKNITTFGKRWIIRYFLIITNLAPILYRARWYIKFKNEKTSGNRQKNENSSV